MFLILKVDYSSKLETISSRTQSKTWRQTLKPPDSLNSPSKLYYQTNSQIIIIFLSPPMFLFLSFVAMPPLSWSSWRRRRTRRLGRRAWLRIWARGRAWGWAGRARILIRGRTIPAQMAFAIAFKTKSFSYGIGLAFILLKCLLIK
jgi:hypothetical protein